MQSAKQKWLPVAGGHKPSKPASHASSRLASGPLEEASKTRAQYGSGAMASDKAAGYSNKTDDDSDDDFADIAGIDKSVAMIQGAMRVRPAQSQSSHCSQENKAEEASKQSSPAKSTGGVKLSNTAVTQKSSRLKNKGKQERRTGGLLEKFEKNPKDELFGVNNEHEGGVSLADVEKGKSVYTAAWNAACAEEEPSTANEFVCRHVDCLESFRKNIHLQRHKELEHEYCMKHDIEFPNWLELIAHKVASADHITCALCGHDFNSEGGRDRHLAVIHPKTQDCTCPGCEVIFISASGMIAHIEKGKCPNISAVQFVKLRFTKSTLGGHIEKLDYRATGAEPADEELPKPLLLEIMNATGSTETVARVRENKDPEYVHIEPHRYEAQKSVGIPAVAAMNALHKEVVAPVFRPVPLAMMPLNQATRIQRFARMMWGDNAIKSVAKMFDPLGMGKPETNPWYTEWEEHYFKSADGDFPCPHVESCCDVFKTGDALRAHLKSAIHSKFDVCCPQCQKVFKSTAALVAHMEAASFKCRIKESEYFQEVLQIATSGFITHDYKNDEHFFMTAEPFGVSAEPIVASGADENANSR